MLLNHLSSCLFAWLFVCFLKLFGHHTFLTYSLHNASLAGKFVDLRKDLILQGSAVNRQLSILKDKPLHDVTVVVIYGENLSKADEHVVLNAVLGVDERRQLLGEVNGLIDCDLSGFLLVFLEEIGKGVDDLPPGCPV